jgi:uncharacterized protein (TIGR03067 family)
MRRLAYLVTIAAAAQALDVNAHASDKDLIQGDWRITSLEQDGEQDEDVIGSTFRFANGKVLFIGRDNPSQSTECVVAIFDEDNPKQIDFKFCADWEDAGTKEQFVGPDAVPAEVVDAMQFAINGFAISNFVLPDGDDAWKGEDEAAEAVEPDDGNAVEAAEPANGFVAVAFEPEDDQRADGIQAGGPVMLAALPLGGVIVLEVFATGDDIVLENIEADQVEVVAETDDGIMKGIYRLEGDALLVCFGDQRPRDFTTAKGQERCLVQLKRVK